MRIIKNKEQALQRHMSIWELGSFGGFEFCVQKMGGDHATHRMVLKMLQ